MMWSWASMSYEQPVFVFLLYNICTLCICICTLLSKAVCMVIKEMSGTCTLKRDNFFFFLFA